MQFMWLQWVAGALEAIGLLVIAWGIREAWRDSGVGEPLVPGQAAARARRLGRRCAAGAQRLLRPRREAPPSSLHLGQAHSRETAMPIQANGGMTLQKFQLLEPPQSLGDVHARLQMLAGMVQGQGIQHRDRLDGLESTAKLARHDLNKVTADLAGAKVELAVGGLRTEAAGLALVGLGLLAQLVGGLVT